MKTSEKVLYIFKKVNWGQSFLDGEAIMYMNEVIKEIEELENVHFGGSGLWNNLMRRILEQIINRNTEGNYLLSSSDKAQIISEILDLFGVIGRLSLKEIEMLVKLNHYDDSDYGNDKKRCAELIEATRNKVGYTKDDIEAYL